MTLTEEQRYRVGYLALRLAVDRKLDREWGKSDPLPLLRLQDLLLGTNLAGDYAGGTGQDRRFSSQQGKLCDFIEAEYGEKIMQIIDAALKDFV